MTAQLGHEGLAETHDFHIGFALGVKVGTALAAAHREGRQSILEALFKAQELDNRGADGRMQTQAALVRTDCGVELNAVTTVDLYVAVVVNPRNSELDESFRLGDTADDVQFSSSGRASTTGSRDSRTSVTAWINSGSPASLFSTSARTFSGTHFLMPLLNPPKF